MRNICLPDLIFLSICVNNEKKSQSAASLSKLANWIVLTSSQAALDKAIRKVYLLMETSGNKGV